MQAEKPSNHSGDPGFLKHKQVKFLLGVLICSAITAAFLTALARLEIDFDILNVLPRTDDVTRDAYTILKKNPALERVAIDLSTADGTADKDRLVRAAEIVTLQLQKSGLIKTVGTDNMSRAMPGLVDAVSDNLALLFNENDLKAIIKSHLLPEKIDAFIAQAREALMGLEGIGQARLIAHDPLNLRYLVLEKFTRSAFYQRARIYKGHLLSPEGNHLLLLCDPAYKSTDSTYARKLTALLDRLSARLAGQKSRPENAVTLRALGAFRYALDNERIVRRDAVRAIILTTAGIAILLLLSFPRAYIGILALIPAVAGAMLALFIYSLFDNQISAMALGFGGALISITVDHSIAYLLFLDRNQRTDARHASREVWRVGLFAAMTTAGAFAVLLISGFPLLAQLGLFAALGIIFSFLFLHTIFPLLLPVLRAARRPPLLPMEIWLNKITTGRGWGLFTVTIIIALFCALLSRPQFSVNLSDMNTVSPDTLATEKMIQTQWGDVASNIYVMVEGRDLPQLLSISDDLTEDWEIRLKQDFLNSGLTPSMIFPGQRRAEKNLAAWKAFWTQERIKDLQSALEQAAEAHGFSAEAFNPFIQQLKVQSRQALQVPEALFEFFGISRQADKKGWTLLAAATPGPAYNADSFFKENKKLGAAVFDSSYYTQRLADILADTFGRMLSFIAAGVVVLLIILFFDWRLVVLTLGPLIFSLVTTLATLKLMGRPLDIPGLMLAIVIFGMGVDYGIFFVRAQQRFLDEHHPSQGPIRSAVFLAAASTMLGMGALIFSDHAVMRSVGLISFLGIGYSVAGAFILLPPILSRVFIAAPPAAVAIAEAGSARHRRQAIKRFAHLEPFPRILARMKMLTDPMFSRLLKWVPQEGTILDIGCGYGIPAAWLLTIYPKLKFIGLDPEIERVRIAGHVIGRQGRVLNTTAQAWLPATTPVEAVLVLDVAHYFSDKDLTEILEKLYQQLAPQGRLIMRITMPVNKERFWKKKEEAFRLRFFRRPQYLRTSERLRQFIEASGLTVLCIEPEERDEVLTWFVAEKRSA